MANTQQESGKSDKQQQGQANLQSNEQSSRESGLTRREQSYSPRFGNSPFSFMRRFSEEMELSLLLFVRLT